ncbi:uncharacterized protein [Rhodnius prolixus]|uniref:uncharacterized protein n=1 Tax=Rhodnius prolixus TaxID=13249 RepID=UPI003D18B9C2
MSEYTDSTFNTKIQNKSILTNRTLVGADPNKFCWTRKLAKHIKEFLPNSKYWEKVDWQSFDPKPLKLKPLKLKSGIITPKLFRYLHCKPDEGCLSSSAISTKSIKTSEATCNSSDLHTMTHSSKRIERIFPTNRLDNLRKYKKKYDWEGETIDNSFLLGTSEVDSAFLKEHLKRPKRVLYENQRKNHRKFKDYKEINRLTRENIENILIKNSLSQKNRKKNYEREFKKIGHQTRSISDKKERRKSKNKQKKRESSKNNGHAERKKRRDKSSHNRRLTRKLIEAGESYKRDFLSAMKDGKVDMELLNEIIGMYTASAALKGKTLPPTNQQPTVAIYQTTVKIGDETAASKVEDAERDSQQEGEPMIDDNSSGDQAISKSVMSAARMYSPSFTQSTYEMVNDDEEHDQFAHLWLNVGIGQINQDMVKYILRPESSRLSLPYFIYEMFENGLDREIAEVREAVSEEKFYEEGEYYLKEESEVCEFERFETEKYVRFHTENQLNKLFTKFHSDPYEEVEEKRARWDLQQLGDEYFIPWKVIKRRIAQLETFRSEQLFHRIPDTESTVSQELCFITDLKRHVGPYLVRAITEVLLLRPNEKPIEWLVRYLDNIIGTNAYEKEMNKRDRDLMRINDDLYVNKLYKPRRFHTIEEPESPDEKSESEITIETELPIDWDPYAWVRPCKKKDESILDFLHGEVMSSETFKETPSQISIHSEDYLSVTSQMTVGSSIYSLSVETLTDEIIEASLTSDKDVEYEEMLQEMAKYPTGYAMDPDVPPPFELIGEDVHFRDSFKPIEPPVRFYSAFNLPTQKTLEEDETNLGMGVLDLFGDEELDNYGYVVDYDTTDDEYDTDYEQTEEVSQNGPIVEDYEESTYDDAQLDVDAEVNSMPPVLDDDSAEALKGILKDRSSAGDR